jgi:hypothetical protein
MVADRTGRHPAYTGSSGCVMRDQGKSSGYALAASADDLRGLHHMCREGRLYDVERWVREGKPLQVVPEAIRKGTRSKTALQVALETGQHSLALLLLRSGYRLELERYAALDKALEARRWDLFDLLIEWGADLKRADVYTVLNTYNVQLYERFRAAGYDLTERHEMGSILGHGTRNWPLLGFVKRHRTEDPRLQTEINIALGYHVREGNERGVNLCLWAGADPHAPAPNPSSSYSDDEGSENEEDRFVGWSAIEEAARHGQLSILKRLGPDPARDDFDALFQYAKSESVMAYLKTIKAPKDLTSILSWHLLFLENRFPWTSRSTGTIEAVFACGVRWEETNRERLGRIRQSLLKVQDYHLKTIVSRLKRPEICSPETYQELFRTPRIQQRLTALGLVKKPVGEREKRKEEIRRHRREVSRLMSRYNRAALYEQVWSQPAQEVAKAYGISGVRLGKVCRKLNLPVPPRGYWARVRSGYTVKRPPLPGMDG